MLCSSLKGNWHFGGSYHLRLQCRRISQARNQCESRWHAELCLAYFLPLKMEATWSSEKPINFQWTAGHYIQEGITINLLINLSIILGIFHLHLPNTVFWNMACRVSRILCCRKLKMMDNVQNNVNVCCHTSLSVTFRLSITYLLLFEYNIVILFPGRYTHIWDLIIPLWCAWCYSM
jgi:hypothetical protein